MAQPTQAKYTGPIESLKGCSVLVRACDKAETVEVQFTSVNERSPSECDGQRDVTDMEQLMFGWHEMPKAHFQKQAKATKGGRGSAKTPPQAEDDG